MHGIIQPSKEQQKHLRPDDEDEDREGTPSTHVSPPPDGNTEEYHKWLNHSKEKWP
jgi:hypothetical protein